MPDQITIAIHDTGTLTEHGVQRICMAIREYATDIIDVAGKGRPEISGDMVDDAVAIRRLRAGNRRPNRNRWVKAIGVISRVAAFLIAMVAGVFASLITTQSTAVAGAIGFSVCFAVALGSELLANWAGSDNG